MSYTPTNWQTGDTVTAEKLNNMESGIAAAVNPFVVTLTPTAQDFSGVMDKTVGEIFEAYQNGKRLLFSLVAGVGTHYDVELTNVNTDADSLYPSFNATLTVAIPTDGLIFAYTGLTDNASKNTYSTKFYPLTPMS